MKNVKLTNYFTNYHMVFLKKKLLYDKWLLTSKKLILVVGPKKNQ